MDTPTANHSHAPETLRPFLQSCGYRAPLLKSLYHFGTADGVKDVDLAAFAHQPTDARSACVAVIQANGNPGETVALYRDVGAPVVFVCQEEQIQWWRQRPETPQCLATLTASELPAFFQEHQEDFAPEAIYRAKTWGRFVSGYQLSFVDAGLMPLVEEEIGKALSNLVERVVDDLFAYLKPPKVKEKFGQWLFQSAFRLLAAKILRDKEVSPFHTLDFADIDDVFSRIATHYGASLGSESLTSQEREALVAASQTVAQCSHLGHMTAESLGYVYENALISKEIRSRLGMHSTPSYLVDYIVWRLAPWIEALPVADRRVFEPACGHAAFLVAAMRLLKELLPASTTPQTSRTYLRQRLHGMEIDAFAIEIARLAMTLADIPYADNWDLQRTDMFVGNTLEQLASRSTVLLANPPFANFKKADREQYGQQGVAPTYMNKTTEMLYRTLPHLQPGAVFGVVVPQGFLHSRNAAELRTVISRDFEIAEICLFPDKVFTFSDIESAILLGRRTHTSRMAARRVRYRRVRESDVQRFRETYVATTERIIPQLHFTSSPLTDMRLPELEEVWEWCKSLPRFDSLANIGKGLEYKGENLLPSDVQTLSAFQFSGAVRGLARLTSDLRIDGQPPEVWMSVDPTVIRRSGTGTTVGVPQILLNYARVSRSPWRLKAVIDREGHAVTSRFLTVRPLSKAMPLEFFWALCNAPFAHAYIYTHAEKRDVLTGMVRAMPVPYISQDEIQRVVEAVRAYFDAVPSPGINVILAPTSDEDKTRKLLTQIDAEILRLYDLPPRLERQLLDLFTGWQRPGVPFDFKRYFPEDFKPCFPLHMYLSESYQRSTAGALRARYEPVAEPAILAALGKALQDFEE